MARLYHTTKSFGFYSASASARSHPFEVWESWLIHLQKPSEFCCQLWIFLNQRFQTLAARYMHTPESWMQMSCKRVCVCVCVWVPGLPYLPPCVAQMPLAWRGLAGCLVRRPVAVVCVCSACGGGRITTQELACRERTGEKAESCHRATVSPVPDQRKAEQDTRFLRRTEVIRIYGESQRLLNRKKKTILKSETTGLFLEGAVFPRSYASPLPSGGGSIVWEHPLNLHVPTGNPWHTGKTHHHHHHQPR